MLPVARLPFAVGFAGATLLASHASAHVRLVSPTPRYPTPNGQDMGQNIKQAPCGTTGDTRTTNASRITVFEPGATIMVQFAETVGHPGHFRIAFDDDGQDALTTPLMRAQVQTGPTFTLPVLVDNIPDMGGQTVNMYTIPVTLPNVECERCTLQLIQVMETTMTWMADDIYYTCADITLRRTGGMGGAGGMGMGGAGGGPGGGGAGIIGGGAGGSAGGLVQGGFGGVAGSGGTGVPATGGATPTGGAAGAPAGGTGGAPTTGGAPAGGSAPTTGGVPTGGGAPPIAEAAPVTEEEGGCSMVPTRSGGHAFTAVALALFGMLVRRRRGSQSAAA